MKTLAILTILLFLSGCGGDTTTPVSSTTPPQPTASGDIKPPASPELE